MPAWARILRTELLCNVRNSSGARGGTVSGPQIVLHNKDPARFGNRYGAIKCCGAKDNPFSAGNAYQVVGFARWILDQQAVFYRALSSSIHQMKVDGSAVWTLAAISLLYGIFHAAGPGHGKAVVSAYLVANRETWRRGIILSLASSLLQAFTAVILVGVEALLVGATGKAMGDTVRLIEIFSFGLIMLLGARLAWSKGNSLVRAYHAFRKRDRSAENDSAKKSCICESDAQPRFSCDPVASSNDGCRAHEFDALPWGHAHGPEPQQLEGPEGWRRGISAVLAVGIRPCSGAILVLVFGLAQGIFWAGVVSTFMMGLGTAITVGGIASLALWARDLAQRITSRGDGYGSLMMRGVEFAAAIAIFCFGGLFFMGYLASERMVGF